MAVIGYGRVSSVGQSLEVQKDQLKAAGCEKLFLEKKSGTSTHGRDQLAMALDYAREGDTFVVTRLDRLARSVSDLLAIIKQLSDKGVGFRCAEQAGVDTTGPMGKLMLTVLGAFAEFENGIRKERQMDGIARAKAEGVYRGRPAKIDAKKIAALRDEGLGATMIAKRLKIGRASVYRVLAIGPRSA
jgi:DNA invertase Pin-like site-specific DNA recombinase